MSEQPGNQTSEIPVKVGLFKRVFYHPNFNVVTGLFGVIGTILAIYFYNESIREPDLTYYISPTRTPIVQKGQLENFSVNFQGLQITNDLSGAEIQIWNQGKLPIKGEDIRKPITIKTPDGEPIYQYSVKPSRNVVTFIGATNGNAMSGVLKIYWDNLELDDGFKIQIIYSGTVDLPLLIDGVVVGQKTIDPYIINTGRRWSNSRETIRKLSLTMLFACFGIMICINILIMLDWKQTRKQKAFHFKVGIAFLIGNVALFSWITYTILSELLRSKPPFGL